MTHRKILYGYRIENGEITVCPKEAAVVSKIAMLYIAGMSYQKIADSLNNNHIPFSPEALLWNKHKVKRLLENQRYMGKDGYPPIIEKEIFVAVQVQIREKTSDCVSTDTRPALLLKEYLRCDCGRSLHRIAGSSRKLCFKCDECGTLVTVQDDDLLDEVNRQITDHMMSVDSGYIPSSEVIRLNNAINRSLEQPDAPEDVVALILRGISARYDCCPPAEKYESAHRNKIDMRCLRQTVSYITVSKEGSITVTFK